MFKRVKKEDAFYYLHIIYTYVSGNSIYDVFDKYSSA